MPALNEERNILSAINSTLKAFSDLNIDGEIIVVNDGSIDRTEELVNDFLKKDNRIRLLKHAVPQGIGASFWEGVDFAKGDAVVMIPGDNENGPYEILRYYKLLEHVDMVVPFAFNKEIRSFFRNVLSFIFRFIINTTFCINFKYTNGNIIYKKLILKDINHRSQGFLYQTDILIRLAKKGYLYAEVPYRLNLRKGGTSKALTFSSFIQVSKEYLRLVKDLYFKWKD
jgi:glycosyltransferase involved in cell wall biosynthesis